MNSVAMASSGPLQVPRITHVAVVVHRGGGVMGPVRRRASFCDCGPSPAGRCSAQQSRGTKADTAASWHTSHTVAHARTRAGPDSRPHGTRSSSPRQGLQTGDWRPTSPKLG